MVFYRKYRSQTIAELDNKKLRETLYSVFSKNDVPHAFLFTGPKGLGKTSTARIIAKVINGEGRRAKTSSLQPLAPALMGPSTSGLACAWMTHGAKMAVLEIGGPAICG